MTTSEGLLPQVRKAIFEHFLEHAAPPVIEELMTGFSLTREDAGDVLRGLEAARHVALVKGTDRILMAFPFSAGATAFRVDVGGRRYFANCAWDAIAFHAMLRTPVRVDSFCHHCGTPITVELRDGRAVLVDPPETVVYLAVPAAHWWDDIIATCSNTMVFFASPEHRDASSLCASDGGATLTPDEVHRLSVPIYEHKLAFDYARPSKPELLAHFATLGLGGPFWEL
jgi:Alkylmercury lyase